MITGDFTSELLKEAEKTFSELLRLHTLNQELLETLSALAKYLGDYAEKNDIAFPNSSAYACLVNRADALMKEIYTEQPCFERLISRRKVTDPYRKDGTDTEVTEP